MKTTLAVLIVLILMPVHVFNLMKLISCQVESRTVTGH